MFIRDSRRTYRTYSYAELILITDLCVFRTPVGVTELMLMLRSLTYSEVPVGTTEIIERILYCRTYSYNRLMCIQDSRRSYRTYAYATEFNLFEGTRRYHRDYRMYTVILIQKYP